MPTRNVVLTDQQTAFVGDLVKIGRYQNASEVLRDGLRLLEDRLQRHQAELQSTQAGIVEGIDQVERKFDAATTLRDPKAIVEHMAAAIEFKDPS